jgi:toluene monooxygenase system ferredoxin subunit
VSYRRALDEDELWVGELRALEVGERKVVLLRTDEGVCAYEDRCAHLGFPLSQGKLEGGVLTCSAHHFQYDALTGRGINPRQTCLVKFPTKIEDGAILIDVDDASGGRDG